MLSNPGEPEQCVGFTLVLTHFCKKHSPEKWGFHFVADKGVAPSQTGGFLPVVLCHVTQGNEDLGWKRPAKAKGMSTLATGAWHGIGSRCTLGQVNHSPHMWRVTGVYQLPSAAGLRGERKHSRNPSCVQDGNNNVT